MLNAPSRVKFTPPPPPHCKTEVPPEVRKLPPPEPDASKLVPTNFVLAVIVVPVIVLAVVPPIAGGADKSSVPPSVKLPVLVTVPDKLMPDTVPVPLTEVTVHDGQVKLSGEIWSARSQGALISKDSMLEVVAIEGATAIVKVKG
jgi:membrane protein implicated in regulation of membrane protease activity